MYTNQPLISLYFTIDVEQLSVGKSKQAVSGALSPSLLLVLVEMYAVCLSRHPLQRAIARYMYMYMCTCVLFFLNLYHHACTMYMYMYMYSCIYIYMYMYVVYMSFELDLSEF